MRTPLNAILGFTQILKRETTNLTLQQRGLEVIQQSGEHLLTLINDILYLAKIEAGKLDLELRELILPSFLDNLADIIHMRCQEKNIEFEHQILGDLPTLVKGDTTRLRQLLLNLLSNAVKFTNKGKVIFKVGYVANFSAVQIDRTSTSVANQDKIRFYIEDTGIGIPEERLADIFTPFYTIKAESSQEGTGLGLSISQNLAEQMGSQIQVKSTLGKGSTFWFDLNFSVLETPMMVTTNDDFAREITGYTGEQRRILVVDDIDTNRDILVNFLTPLGFDILEASSGAEAIALTHKNKLDAIFLDLIMPEVNGCEAIRRLRKESQFQDLPIIIISASTLPIHKSQCYEVGANEFLNKPLSFEQLLRILEIYLKLEWITSDGTTRSLLTQPLPATPAAKNTAAQSLIILSQEKLTHLWNLIIQGDIRSVISAVNHWQQDEPQATDFMQQIIKLAETCQMKKLKELIRQHLEEALSREQGAGE
ncbi:ATP-binding protein [Aetokthonos hydrillicola Thurmond2011]|uniref:Circadian input-output histidine kinase CikA n=1 Tax=Aetokthonos hydrillicola Thurmond2011 TaxID=2712845 RepID=A0AAP5MCD0_9CYAN|nr:response regulator [Aetokthonos hydrillicola CCALA 1050]MBW4589293.1 response regulator [Aetokthonos hydrillicola CCALA 1050]MDR9898173.1 ATP-binding protein [Aetokthonos hydrillicola Thurmond2011]